jgi:hypothetical protein
VINVIPLRQKPYNDSYHVERYIKRGMPTKIVTPSGLLPVLLYLDPGFVTTEVTAVSDP